MLICHLSLNLTNVRNKNLTGIGKLKYKMIKYCRRRLSMPENKKVIILIEKLARAHTFKVLVVYV